jgi:cyclic dehypoxanthinyl futalosine synthase
MTTPARPHDAAAALAFSAAAGDLRLTPDQALMLLRDGDLLTLGQAASAMRRRLVPDDDVTYIIDRNVNYTNVCVSGCTFWRSTATKPMPTPTCSARSGLKVAETMRSCCLILRGGKHPQLELGWYEGMLRDITADNPPLHVHGFGPPEIVHISRLSGISTAETLSRLRDAGLDSLPGGGAEILVDRVRGHVSPKKATSDEWLGVMREAHKLDISTTATMMFGGLETLEERVEHFARVREVQDEAVSAGHVGFRAFIPWSFQPGNTELAESELATSGEQMTAASGWEYLKTLAVARLFLDSVRNIQASWVTQGGKVGQIALAFGANDMGSTMIEENVVAAAGTRFMLARDELVRIISDAGYTPVQRDTLYREVRRF